MSFSQAIAYAVDPTRVPAKTSGGHDRGLYAGYINQDEFKGVTFTATEILNDPKKYRQQLHPKAVLVGAAWHSRAYNRGGTIDLHLTAAGSIPGVFVHANYVEAQLDLRTFPGLNVRIRLALEWIVTFCLALCMQIPKVRRWDWIPLIGSVLVVVFLAFVVFFVFGILFEFAIPISAIFLHYLTEKVLHWRHLARLAVP